MVVDPDCVSEEDFHAAEHLGREYVLKVSGRVRERAPEAINPNMITGEIEVLANAVEVLNTSVTPPFSIEDGIETDEITRMKWRYLDIRRPEMLANLKLRHTVTQAMRRALDERGFLEIETPILANSTPEGARDYIVPSRPNPGKFYALPQSPQQFKQMLMCAGVERYYQIARCFRDEDLRADRQPEFTQVDIEMSFVEGDDVCDMMEGVMAETLKAVGVTDVTFPLQKMQYADAMRLYGCDRPDVRFGMLLHDITDIVKDTGFKVFCERGPVRRRGEGHQRQGCRRLVPRRGGEARQHRRGQRRQGHGLGGVHHRWPGEEPHQEVLHRRGVGGPEGRDGSRARRSFAVRGR